VAREKLQAVITPLSVKTGHSKNKKLLVCGFVSLTHLAMKAVTKTNKGGIRLLKINLKVLRGSHAFPVFAWASHATPCANGSMLRTNTNKEIASITFSVIKIFVLIWP